MKAAVFTDGGRVELVGLPRPACGAGEVLLEVAACDVLETDPAATPAGQVPGRAMAGIVAEVGLGIKRWSPGNRLAIGAAVHCGVCHYCRRGLFNLCDRLKLFGRDFAGGLAEFALLNREVVDHGIVNKVPDGLRLSHAVLADAVAAALAVHDDLAVSETDTVALLGCGAAGLLHFQLLDVRDASVIIVEPSSSLLERAERDFDVQFTVNSTAVDVAEAVIELTEGLGADVVISPAHSPEALGLAVSAGRKRSRIALLGAPPNGRAELDVTAVHQRELRIFGSTSYHPGYHARALDALASGALHCDKLITAYPLEQAERALRDARGGETLLPVICPRDDAAASPALPS
ncbi:MAG: alcohol dehydrogenase catalytic domain-containing protein [Bryobacteraceae bacterium]|nr:alcohol dehydrogenase catalytic domain-containing protein [Bryobacteraceae bacterium]